MKIYYFLTAKYNFFSGLTLLLVMLDAPSTVTNSSVWRQKNFHKLAIHQTAKKKKKKNESRTFVFFSPIIQPIWNVSDRFCVFHESSECNFRVINKKKCKTQQCIGSAKKKETVYQTSDKCKISENLDKSVVFRLSSLSLFLVAMINYTCWNGVKKK